MFKKLSDFILSPNVVIFVVFGFLGGLSVILLQVKFLFPLWTPVVLFLTTLMFGMMYGYHWYTDYTFNSEGADFIYSRKNNIPLMMVEAHNGVGKWVKGVKEKTGDIFFAFNREGNEGIHIDPAVQSGSVPITNMPHGLRVYHYGTGSPFPMGSKQAIAMDEILKHVRKNYPDLVVFDSETILEYVARNRNELAHDCKNLASQVDVNVPVPEEACKEFAGTIVEQVKKEAEKQGITEDDKIIAESQRIYNEKIKEFVTEYRANWLVKTFMKIQDETAKLPVPQSRLFSYAEAFMNSISAFTAFDYQTLMQLFEMIARKENDIDLKWLFGACAAIGIGVILIGVGYSIFNSAR